MRRKDAKARQSIRVHIERLVIDDTLVSSSQGEALQAAIETELARMVGDHGLSPFSETAIPSLAAPDIRLANEARPIAVGQHIAHAVYAGLGAANPGPSGTQTVGGTR